MTKYSAGWPARSLRSCVASTSYVHAASRVGDLRRRRERGEGAPDGDKAEKKTYFRYTGFMGHEKHIPFRKMIEETPEKVIDLAVKGMLPKNNLGRLMRKEVEGLRRTVAPTRGAAAAVLEI